LNAIFCDECKKEFIMNIETEELGDSVERIYFRCTHCNKEYTSYYTDTLIRIKQNKIKNIQDKYNKVRGKDIKQANKFIKQYEKLKKEIGKDMDNLRKKIEASTK